MPLAQGFLTRPLGLWLLTLAVAVVLLGLGYELCRSNLEPQLQEARAQLAQEGSRANRLAAENQRLEARLAQAQAEVEARQDQRPSPPPRPAPELAGEPEAIPSRLLHRGEAAELLEGRVVLVLEGFAGDRRQAQLLLREPGGKEHRLQLGPGGEVTLNLEGRSYRLVLRKILANSIVYSLRPQEETPGPRRGR